MAQQIIQSGLHVSGNLSCEGFSPPNACIYDDQVGTPSGTRSPIGAEKVEHQLFARLAQVHGSAATAERRVIHCAHAAGTIESVVAGLVVACIGDSTITVDVRKNGTTILTGTIGLDSTNVAYAEEAGTISANTYAAGDVLEAVVTVSAGTGTLGQGLYVSVVLRENPTP